MRDFDTWLSTMRDSINRYGYYVDFDKIYENVDSIKVELNILNSLIGSKNIEKEMTNILLKYPETLKCIPLLLAIRYNEIYVCDDEGSFLFDFNHPNYSIDEYVVFMRKTGLLELVSSHIVNNLFDYAMGVETGLDSNARKNRGGHQMEDLVESYIKKTKKNYYKEMYLSDIEEKWKLDLSSVSADGNTRKRFDFVVEGQKAIYGIETNFYSGGGSKLNETARSYKMIAEEAESIKGFEFVWITDGKGWISARNNLKETFEKMEHLYNIYDLEREQLKELFL